LEAIGLLDRVLRFTGRHIDECESPGTSGFAIVDELDRFDFAVALKEATYFIFGRGEWQVANVDRRHSTNLTNGACSVGIRNGVLPLTRGFNTQTPPRQSQRRGLYL
jgi:hypothetical protein